MAKVFDPEYFKKLSYVKQIRLLKIINSGIKNPDSKMGC